MSRCAPPRYSCARATEALLGRALPDLGRDLRRGGGRAEVAGGDCAVVLGTRRRLCHAARTDSFLERPRRHSTHHLRFAL